MSTTPPPDRPTEPLRPAYTAPVVEERVMAPAPDPNALLLRLEDAIDGLRTWLVLVGLIAVAALGVALYALLTDDTGDGRAAGGSRGGLASDARVSTLDERVDRLSRQLRAVRASAGSSDVADRVDELEQTVRTLSDRPQAPQAPQGTDATQAVQELSGRIDALARDVEQLKQARPAP